MALSQLRYRARYGDDDDKKSCTTRPREHHRQRHRAGLLQPKAPTRNLPIRNFQICSGKTTGHCSHIQSVHRPCSRRGDRSAASHRWGQAQPVSSVARRLPPPSVMLIRRRRRQQQLLRSDEQRSPTRRQQQVRTASLVAGTPAGGGMPSIVRENRAVFSSPGATRPWPGVQVVQQQGAFHPAAAAVVGGFL